MKRTSLFVDSKLLVRAQQYAQKHGMSFAMVVREALTAYITARPQVTSLPSFAGKFASGATDTSDKTDQFLWSDPHR